MYKCPPNFLEFVAAREAPDLLEQACHLIHSITTTRLISKTLEPLTPLVTHTR
jgi:hypothetical protein